MTNTQRLINAVAAEFGTTADRLLKRDRHHSAVLARNIAVYWLRRVGQLSYPEVGRVIGRHHTSVMHSVREVEWWIRKDPDLALSIFGAIGDRLGLRLREAA